MYQKYTVANNVFPFAGDQITPVISSDTQAAGISAKDICAPRHLLPGRHPTFSLPGNQPSQQPTGGPIL